MSDASSAVTYTFVYTDSEPWRYYGEESDEAGSPGVIVYEYDGLPMQLVTPPSLDYVPGPEHPPSPDYYPVLSTHPHLLRYHILCGSEDPDEDPEDDHADYPADGGDGDDEPSDDDDDDNDTDDEDEEPVEDEEDNEEEEARKTVRLEPSMSVSIEACIARHAALLSPPLPVPSPPLPFPSPLTTSSTDTGAPLGYRVAGIRMRALLPSTSRVTDIPEADVPPRKRACLTTLALRFEVEKSSTASAARQPGPIEFDLRRYRVEQAGYGITDTWDEIVNTLMEIAPTTLEGAQDDRALLRARVNTLFRDRPDHCRTTMLLDREVMYAREAWAGSKDRSAAITAHVRILEAHVAALIAQTSSLLTQLTTALGRIEILKARDPEPQEGPTEAGSSC
uniref:Uncharacterized protein n=1 Tax=Tanacetum cinerariifolium TaxID=118510 RepID=A0A699IYF7_TANCI|nr:hypothetical protein [Tanacetum cinerariifolium]